MASTVSKCKDRQTDKATRDRSCENLIAKR